MRNRETTGIRNSETLVELLKRRAEQNSDDTAFLFLKKQGKEKQIVTFGGLDQEARKIAARLQKVCNTDDKAVLVFPSGLPFVYAFYGCLYAGVKAIPLNLPSRYQIKTNSDNARHKLVMKDCNANIVLSTLEDQPFVKGLFEQDEDLAGIHYIATELVEDDEYDYEEVQPTAEELAFLQYTSGSTGQPKGVMISHENVMANLRALEQAAGCHQDDVFANWIPLYHDMGLVVAILLPVYLGSISILCSPLEFIQRPLLWFRVISEYQATISGGSNFAYELCKQRVRLENCSEIDLSTWRIAFNGAEPIHAETLIDFSEKFSHLGFQYSALFPSYGMAEATAFLSAKKDDSGPRITGFDKATLESNIAVKGAQSDSSKVKRLVSCGKVQDHHELRIVNSITKDVNSEGEIGEIWVSGPSISNGYWEKPAESRAAFRNGLPEESSEEIEYLKTGDLGFIFENELYVTGREKDVLIIRGANYFPQDIERAVESSVTELRVGTSASFTVDRKSLPGEERLVVAVEVKSEMQQDIVIETFTAIRRTILDNFNLSIGTIILLTKGSARKTTSGKIQRAVTKKCYLNNTLSIAHHHDFY